MGSLFQRLPFSNAKKEAKSFSPPSGCLAWARHALYPALLRGSPRWAILGPARLNRRPAGFPTAQCLRSASVVNGAPRSKTKARRPDSRPDFDGCTSIPWSEHAPGGVTTMVVNDDAVYLSARGALRFIASMLAPTEGTRMASNQADRSTASLLIVIWLLMFLPPREAEWRFCAVGKPAWMPG